MKKKVYLLLTALSFTMLVSAQMPFAWWATLPADYQTNPYARQQLKVLKVVDDDIINADGVEAIWNTVASEYIFDVNNQTSGHPEQSPEKFTGKCALMAGADYFYVVLNVIDDEISPGGEHKDNVELVLSPNDGPKDIDGSTLLPDTLSAPWVWDGDAHDYHLGDDNHFDVATIHDMARYGLWGDDGDVKLGGITPVTNQELYAGTMFFDSNYIGTDSAQIHITPKFGATSAALTVVEEDQTGGYFLLVMLPWEVLNDEALENYGDKMSFAVRVEDNTEVSDSSYVYWGGATTNDTYWGVHFYGAVAELWDSSTAISLNHANSDVDVFFSNDKLIVSDEISSVEVYNLSGTKVVSYNNPKGNINVNSLARGVYLAKVKSGDGKVSVLKFVK
jgi:hypothetical protein